MPTTFKPLLIAWIASLVIVLGGLMLLQVTYDPVLEEPEAIVAEDITPEPEVIPPRVMPIEAIPALLEMTDRGPLPIIGQDGTEPANAYAANPVEADGLNKIAIIVTDLGPIARNVRRALSDLPTRTTLAFSPYGAGINGWAEQARRAGHETMLMVPMEPNNYPQNDPGPLTLTVNAPRTGNLNLLRDSLGKLTGYTGIVTHMGARFTAAGQSIRPVLEELKSRGLMYIDSRASTYSRGPEMARALSVPSATNTITGYLDEDLSAAVINERLDQLEQQAARDGYALGIARPYPVSVESISAWAAGLESRGAIIVPVSQIADLQPSAP
ncbi:divergent polysaccharide deacetylase family protein [Kordiimonas aquimaris]|uniref:divergent polysaccharide deacetylase family protein n=1 Tax=Kordiimonas aquimaris TaxID=707591 RepID=UPI0021CF64D2|nr:divergent polysaccharide deacetylase family protein [Kordiimonas aquimaris]